MFYRSRKKQGAKMIKLIGIGALFLSASFISINVYAFSDAQLCQAGIATSDGHSAKPVKVLSSKKGLVEVSYLRPDDKKLFKFWCKITPTEILWRDEYIASGWGKNTRIFYKVLAKNKLEIRISLAGESEDAEKRIFSSSDF